MANSTTTLHGRIDAVVTYDDPSIAGAFTIKVGGSDVTFHCEEPALARALQAVFRAFRPTIPPVAS